MVVLQVYTTTLDRTMYNVNLPNGLYEFRMIDYTFIDTLANTNHSVTTVSSDCWRIPYGNVSRSNTLYFVNKSDNGRASPQGTYNFLCDIRSGQMDMTLTTTGGNFTFALITFDVQQAKGYDNFFPLI
jgi:hypothetical protein